MTLDGILDQNWFSFAKRAIRRQLVKLNKFCRLNNTIASLIHFLMLLSSKTGLVFREYMQCLEARGYQFAIYYQMVQK